MKKLLATLVVALGVSSLFAYQYFDGVRTWTLEKDKKVGEVDVNGETVYNYVITGCTPAPSGEFTIPAKLGPYNVYGVDGYAFYNVATNITKLTVEPGVRKIGGYAFGCDSANTNLSQLTEIKLPAGMDHIANLAFENSKIDVANRDNGLVVDGYLIRYTGTNETWAVPAGVKTICRYAINNKYLTRVTLPAGLESVQYQGCVNVTVEEIPDTVVSFADSAFQGCIIKSLKLNKNFTDLDELGKDDLDNEVSFSRAFAGAQFESIDFGDGVKAIPDRLFSSVTQLGSVKFGAGLRQIGNFAFDGCTALSNVNFTAGIQVIGVAAFQNTKLTTVDLSACTALWEISDGCFDGCPLSKVTLNEGLTSIGDNAFAAKGRAETSLDNVKIPASVEEIGDDVFNNCTNLWTVTGGEGVTEFGSLGNGVPAFACEEKDKDGKELPFKLVTFGKVVLGFQGVCPPALTAADFGTAEGIAESAFDFDYNESVSNLTSVTFSDAMRYVGTFAFYAATNLTTIVWPANSALLEIGEKAFYKTGIEKLEGSFKAIGVSAFERCERLASVNIAVDEVEDVYGNEEGGLIDDGAFRGCTNLTSAVVACVYVGDPYRAPAGRPALFNGCENLKEVKLVVEKTINAPIFRSCDSIAKATLDLEDIPGGLLQGCTNLTEVAIGDSVETIGASAFEGCSNLATVTGCANVEAVFDKAFDGTKFFNDAKAGETVVGSVLFRYVDTGSEKDGAAELSDAFSVIAANAFTSNNLAKITIPAAVEQLEARTFVACTNLEVVVLKNNEIRIASPVEDGCTKLVASVTGGAYTGLQVAKGGFLYKRWIGPDTDGYYVADFEKVRFHNDVAQDGAFDPAKASSYTGWIMDGRQVVGTLTVKTGKANKDGLVNVTAAVQLSGLKKTYTAQFSVNKDGKAVIDDPDSNWYNELAGDENAGKDGLVLGGNWLSGDMTIAGKTYGVRGGNDKNNVEAFENYSTRVWTMALSSIAPDTTLANVTGYSTLTVTPAKKGKIKVTGMMADGTKVSTTAQMGAGDNGVVAAPVSVGLYTGKRGGFSFLLQFYMDGDTPKMWFDAADPDGRIGAWYLPYTHEHYRLWATVGLGATAVGEVDLKGNGVKTEVTEVEISDPSRVPARPVGYAEEMLARACKGFYALYDGGEFTLNAKGNWTFAKQAKVSLAKDKDLKTYEAEIARAILDQKRDFMTPDGKWLEAYDVDWDDVTYRTTPLSWLVWDIGSKLDRDGKLVEGKNDNACGLKLSYKQKTGAFTGSSLYYWVDMTKPEKPALKKGKFTINGVAIDGKLYGAAVAKKIASFLDEPAALKARRRCLNPIAGRLRRLTTSALF